jgi:flagellar hook-associated protein 2
MRFDTPANQTARDAKLTVNGVPDIIRSSNRITGVIPDATINVTAPTAGATAVLSLQREAGGVKDLIKQVVNSYNDLQAIVTAARDPNSSVEKLGGSLVGDNTVRDLMQRVRNILLPTSGSSAGRGIGNNPYVATGSSTLNGLRDLGVMIDTDGTMKFSSIKEFDPTNPNANQQLLKIGDESTVDKLLSNSFEEVAALFQGKDGKPGIARDMSDLLSGNGRYIDTSFTPSSPAKLLVATQRNLQGYIRNDQDRMSALEDRMKTLLDRYMRQFAIMDSLVGQSKSERTGVENSFKAMSGSR